MFTELQVKASEPLCGSSGKTYPLRHSKSSVSLQFHNLYFKPLYRKRISLLIGIETLISKGESLNALHSFEISNSSESLRISAAMKALMLLGFKAPKKK